LMNESISRAAGTQHGQEMPPAAMEALIRSIDRTARQRSTAYASITDDIHARGMAAGELTPMVLTPPGKRRTQPKQQESLVYAE